MQVRNKGNVKGDEIERPYLEIGERISKWRIEAKIPQSELAKESGVSESSIGRVEVGRRSPTIELLQHLRAKHNVDLNYIICGE